MPRHSGNTAATGRKQKRPGSREDHGGTGRFGWLDGTGRRRLRACERVSAQSWESCWYAGDDPQTVTGGAVLNFGSRAAAREGLSGEAGTAANCFFRGATSKSQDFQAQELPGGGYRLQFFSPANNPGYGKLYVQEIDRTGNVLRRYKDTIGPDGFIERKMVQ